MKKNLLVAQSGGPTAAINATLAGVIKGAMVSAEIDRIYGGLNGIAGILEDKIVALDEQCFSDELLHKLCCTPSMALGSCRLKMKDPSITPDVYAKILEVFKRLDIGYFLYIGGNDSMDTVDKISKYCSQNNYDIKVVGVPKTIDNDLVMTDHTPGFGSACKYVISSIMEVAYDTAVYDQPSIVVVEIMGRDSGWLTASSALARLNGGTAPHLVYIPEIAFDHDQFIAEIKEAIQKHTTVVVAVSEGIRTADGKYAHQTAESTLKDAFGHAILGGAGKYLENVIKNEVGCKVRSIELSTLQRAASHCASKADIDESFMVGSCAVQMATAGLTAVMAAIEREHSMPYISRVVPVPVSQVANAVKAFPVEWFNSDYSLTDDAIEYFLPLIQGEVERPAKNGMADFFKIDRTAIV